MRNMRGIMGLQNGLNWSITLCIIFRTTVLRTFSSTHDYEHMNHAYGTGVPSLDSS